MIWKFIVLGTIAFLLGLGAGLANADSPVTLRDSIEAELQKSYPAARIEIGSTIDWSRGTLPSSIFATRLIGEAPGGTARILVEGATASAEGIVHFAAKVPGYFAIHRVLPGERVDPQNFKKADIDVTQGEAHEIRGVILPQGSELNGLESRQTILEGQILVSSAVRKLPDVRRGDAVRIHLISGDLTVSLPGIAQETGYLNGHVRVISEQTKRELVGEVQGDHVVEVKL